MRGEETCAKKKCREDLIKFILESRTKGERVILMIDGNENMRTGALAKRLKQRDINMRDSIREKVGSLKFPTWFRGQEQIDAIWVSDELKVESATMLPFFFSIGDHRGIMIDIPEHMLLGNKLIKIKRPYARRLICGRPEVRNKYVKLLERYCTKNKLQEKIDWVRINKEHMSRRKLNKIINKLDKIKAEGMLQAEKKCRKLNMGKIPYSPQLAVQANRVILVRSLQRRIKGAKVKKATIGKLVKKAELDEKVLDELKKEEAINNRLQKELIKYWEMKAQAWSLRRNFLDTLINKATGNNKKRLIDIKKGKSRAYNGEFGRR